MCLIIRNINTLCIWFRGGDLNGFEDIKPFMNCRVVPQGTSQSMILNVFIISNMNIHVQMYMD